MRLTLATALLCAAMSVGVPAGVRAADAGPWQWQQPMSFPANMAPMGANDLRKHIGGWVYAPDGSVIGSLDSFTTDNEAIVRSGMFYMGSMKYLILPNKNLAVMSGRLYAHDIDAGKAKKTVTPKNLAVGL